MKTTTDTTATHPLVEFREAFRGTPTVWIASDAVEAVGEYVDDLPHHPRSDIHLRSGVKLRVHGDHRDLVRRLGLQTPPLTEQDRHHPGKGRTA